MLGARREPAPHGEPVVKFVVVAHARLGLLAYLLTFAVLLLVGERGAPGRWKGPG
jgi:hypothetical protein